MCVQCVTKNKTQYNFHQSVCILCVLFYIIINNIVNGDLCVSAVIKYVVLPIEKISNYFYILFVLFCPYAIWYDRFE